MSSDKLSLGFCPSVSVICKINLFHLFFLVVTSILEQFLIFLYKSWRLDFFIFTIFFKRYNSYIYNNLHFTTRCPSSIRPSDLECSIHIYCAHLQLMLNTICVFNYVMSAVHLHQLYVYFKLMNKITYAKEKIYMPAGGCGC